MRPSTAPSTSVARITAESLAPSARDTANSCSRCAARASSTEARFTISINARTAPDAAEHHERGSSRRDHVSLQADGTEPEALAS